MQFLSFKISTLSSIIGLLMINIAHADNHVSANHVSANHVNADHYNSVKKSDESIPSVTLDPIIVTASRTATKSSDLLAKTLVIDKQALQSYQGQTVLDVIKNQAEFSHYTNGGLGTSSNFYVRGYDSKRVLVLVDGIRYGSLSTGKPAINLLPTEQIERIEILYGASGSSIYGADAMGGVIQIFTKASQNDTQTESGLSITAGAGSHDHYKYGVSGLLKTKTGSSIQLSAGHNQTKGINATTVDNAWAYHDDIDGFESDNASLALQHKINDNVTTGLTGLYSQSKTEYDNGASVDDVYGKQKNGAAQAYLQWKYASDSEIKLQYGSSIDRLTSHDSLDATENIKESTLNSQQDQASLTGRHQLPNDMGSLIYGVEHLNQQLDSSEYNTEDRQINSGFAGYQLLTDNYDIQANVRYDDSSQYGDVSTYNLGLAYNFNNDFRLGASYAKGFSVPSLNDLYYPDSGNPQLVPEYSDNYELFAELNSDYSSTRITGYKNKVTDMISWKKTNPDDPDDWSGNMQNIDEVDIDGVSLTSDWSIDNYLFGIHYNYQDAKNSLTDAVLPIRPMHSGLLYTGYQTADFEIRAEYQHVNKYFDNSNTLPSRGLVNLTGNYYLTPKLTASTRINNLTNQDYVTLTGYNTDKSNVFVGFTYNY